MPLTSPGPGTPQRKLRGLINAIKAVRAGMSTRSLSSADLRDFAQDPTITDAEMRPLLRAWFSYQAKTVAARIAAWFSCLTRSQVRKQRTMLSN